MNPYDPRPLPLPYGYWVPGADLLAGEYPGTPSAGADAEDRLRRLHAAGVSCFYDLTEEGELTPYAHRLADVWGEDRCLYRRFPIRDVSVPQDPSEMRALLDRLDADLAMGHRVYLHCWGGVGRTGTTVGSFLVRRGRSGVEALAEVARLFATTPKKAGRTAPENDEQRSFVLRWAEHDPVARGKAGGRACPPDRVRGALLGLAVGDALGTTLEFETPGTFEPITDMVGGGPFGLKPGAWTDDTSMALCMAESLVETGGFDAGDQMERYVRWWREGHLSSTGRCFDIGNITRQALARFEATGDPMAGSTEPHTAGNGSLMRLAPVVLYFRHDPAWAVQLAGESSRTTHGTPAAVDACRYFAALLLGALQCVPRDELLSWEWVAPLPFWREHPLHPEVEAVARGSWRGKEAHEIDASGHVIRTLEAALWAFHGAEDFRSGALAAVNLGRDADTTGAVYGQIAGAWFGEEAIPLEWRSRLAMRERVEGLAEGLVEQGADPEGSDAGTVGDDRPREERPFPMTTEGITRERIDELLRYLPMFERGGQETQATWWMEGPTPEDPAIYSPYPEYPEEVENFFQLLTQEWWSDRGYIPDQTWELIRDPRNIEAASLAEVKSMLTYCARGERFCPGHQGVMVQEGKVVLLLRRLAELREGVGE